MIKNIVIATILITQMLLVNVRADTKISIENGQNTFNIYEGEYIPSEEYGAINNNTYVVLYVEDSQGKVLENKQYIIDYRSKRSIEETLGLDEHMLIYEKNEVKLYEIQSEYVLNKININNREFKINTFYILNIILKKENEFKYKNKIEYKELDKKIDTKKYLNIRRGYDEILEKNTILTIFSTSIITIIVILGLKFIFS